MVKVFDFLGFKNQEDWKKILTKNPIKILKEIAMAVCNIEMPFYLDGSSPLHIAVWLGNVEVYQYVYAIEKNPIDNQEGSLLHWAALNPNQFDV